MSNTIAVTQMTGYPYPIHVEGPRGQGMALTTDEAMALLGELAAELVEVGAADGPLGLALGLVLEAMADAMARRQ